MQKIIKVAVVTIFMVSVVASLVFAQHIYDPFMERNIREGFRQDRARRMYDPPVVIFRPEVPVLGLQ